MYFSKLSSVGPCPVCWGTLVTPSTLPLWFRALLNCVPTGTTSSRPAYNPDECHQALTAEIPSYASLHITQEPSYVRKPDSYNHCALSCLTTSLSETYVVPPSIRVLRDRVFALVYVAERNTSADLKSPPREKNRTNM